MRGLILSIFFLPIFAQHTRVLLKDVQVVTAQKNLQTTGRRGPPVPQLTCIGGGCDVAAVSSIQCKNQGWDGRDVNWKCKATLPVGWELDRTEVLCEGFESPDDPYILAGSCGVEYTLKKMYTHPPPSPKRIYTKTVEHTTPTKYDTLDVLAGILLCFGVMFLLFYLCQDPHYVESPRLRRSSRIRGRPPPVYVSEPVYVSQPVGSSYNQGYRDASVDSFVYNNVAPVREVHTERVIVEERQRSPSPEPVRHRSPSPQKTHVSTSYATTRRR